MVQKHSTKEKRSQSRPGRAFPQETLEGATGRRDGSRTIRPAVARLGSLVDLGIVHRDKQKHEGQYLAPFVHLSRGARQTLPRVCSGREALGDPGGGFSVRRGGQPEGGSPAGPRVFHPPLLSLQNEAPTSVPSLAGHWAGRLIGTLY